MRSAVRFKRTFLVLLPVIALACAVSVASASAHGRSHNRFGPEWAHHGYWGNDAVVSGTVTSVASGSFGANAHVVTAGPGNSGTTPATTPVTIKVGSSTKVIAQGKSGITTGDDFYAVYRGVPSSTPLATLATDTPSVVYAFAPPTPEVEVKGVVTTAPAAGSDSFVATAYVVTPPQTFKFGGGFGGGHGGGFGGGGAGGFGGVHGGGYSQGGGNAFGLGYSYGHGVKGDYGFGATPTSFGRGGHVKVHLLPGSTPVSQGTPNTTITTDASTKITINGQTSSVSDLAVGDKFTATFDGTPSESLATITATPAVSIAAFAPPKPNVLYAFVGTVASVTSTSVTVNVTNSIPSGLFSGTDTFTVGPQTLVLGNSSTSLLGSISNVAAGDVVAGGLVAPSGESASTVEASPLQILVDFPVASSTTTTTTTTTTTPTTTTPATTSASIKRADKRAEKKAEAKALKLLRSKDRAKLAKKAKKHTKKHSTKKK